MGGKKRRTKRKHKRTHGSREEPKKAENENNKGDIQSLDDHILEEIFMNLNYCDLIVVEKVCQRWKNICHDFWPFELSRHLEFDDFHLHNCSSFKYFIELLSRVGWFTTSLSYTADNYKCATCVANAYAENDENKYSDYEISQKIIEVIAAECPILTSLGLWKIPDTTALKALAEFEFVPNLTQLCLSQMKLLDDTLEKILEKAISLTVLNLNSTTLLEGQSLLKLSPACTFLIITACNDLKKDILLDVFARLPNLNDIGAMTLKPLTFDLLSNQFNLTKLAVQEAMFFKGFNEDLLPSLNPYLPHLTHLELTENSYVTNEVLNALPQLCPNLEVLDISGCYRSSKDEGLKISNFGIGQLAKLPKLRHLKLNDLPNLNFDKIANVAVLNLSRFSQLKKLKCNNSGQDKMTKSGLSRMINICPQLEVLNFTENFYITNYFLMETFVNVLPRDHDYGLAIRFSKKPGVDFDLFKAYLLKHRFIHIYF